MIIFVVGNVYIFNSSNYKCVYILGLYFGYHNILLKLYDFFIHNIHLLYFPPSQKKNKQKL